MPSSISSEPAVLHLKAGLVVLFVGKMNSDDKMVIYGKMVSPLQTAYYEL